MGARPSPPRPPIIRQEIGLCRTAPPPTIRPLVNFRNARAPVIPPPSDTGLIGVCRSLTTVWRTTGIPQTLAIPVTNGPQQRLQASSAGLSRARPTSTGRWETWPLIVWLMQITAAVMAPASNLAVAESWVETQESHPFQIRTEFSLQKHPGLLQECRSLQAEIGRALELPIGNAPIQISLFRSKRTYLRHLEQRVPAGLHRKALFVQGPDRSRLYVYRSSTLLIDLRHETTHALIHNTLPYVPLWLDEGLAGHFEVAAERQRWGHQHLQRLRWSALLGWRPNLKKLELQRDQSRFSAGAYRESWAWVHFLLHESQDSRRALVDYIQQIHERQQPGPMSSWLRERVPQAETRLLEHIRQRRPASDR